MSARRLPVRPDLDQLKNQSKDLLKAYRDGDPEASAHFAELHPDTPDASRAKLADAGFPNPKVQIVMEPAWTPQRISEAGRKALGI